MGFRTGGLRKNFLLEGTSAVYTESVVLENTANLVSTCVKTIIIKQFEGTCGFLRCKCTEISCWCKYKHASKEFYKKAKFMNFG